MHLHFELSFLCPVTRPETPYFAGETVHKVGTGAIICGCYDLHQERCPLTERLFLLPTPLVTLFPVTNFMSPDEPIDGHLGTCFQAGS
jgi:hypothetical protein